MPSIPETVEGIDQRTTQLREQMRAAEQAGDTDLTKQIDIEMDTLHQRRRNLLPIHDYPDDEPCCRSC